MGDGYQEGFYAGLKLAKATNSIVVAVNYRVGPFGFLSHDILQREDQNNSTGNMGVRDQQAGLQWVRDNIASFGGDPKRVTIFGESAGGFSVCWHLASSTSKDLFHGAIIESGSCDAKEFFRHAKDQNQFGDKYAASVGCNSTAKGSSDASFLACLRSKTTVELMNGVLNWFNPNWPSKNNLFLTSSSTTSLASSPYTMFGVGLPGLAPVMPWGPVIDGTSVGTQDLPLTILQEGKGNYVPTIWGSNRDEGSLFVPLVSLIIKGSSFPMNELSINLTLQHFFKNNQSMVADVLALYPLGDYKNSQDSRAASILRDCFFSCAMRRGARAMDAYLPEKAWLYHFEFPMEYNPMYHLLGNFHASELGFVFDTWVLPTSNSQDMSATFQRYWGNLANSGDVNVDYNKTCCSERRDSNTGSGVGGVGGSPSTTYWPSHNRTDDWNIVLDMPANAQQHLYEEKCDFWDANIRFIHSSRSFWFNNNNNSST